MVTVGLVKDERWPDAIIGQPGDGVDVEVDAETLARWRATIAAYEAVQTEMLNAMENAVVES